MSDRSPPEHHLLAHQIVVCACEGCPEVGKRTIGPLPAGTRLVRLRCPRDFEPAHMLGLLLNGAEGVLIVGCAEGRQWEAASDYEIEERLKVTRCCLEQAGLAPDRVATEWISEGAWKRVIAAIEGLRRSHSDAPRVNAAPR